MTVFKDLKIKLFDDKEVLRLHAFAKHFEALANELDAIDNAWVCDCGSFEYTDLHRDSLVVERACNKCNERYAVNLVDSSVTHSKGSD